jgi:hypothetical protein
MPTTPSKPSSGKDRPDYMVILGLMPPYSSEDVEKAYHAKLKEIRPDLGGDREAFYALQKAYVDAKEYIKFRGDRRGWIARQMDEYLAVQEAIERLREFGAVVETDSLDWLKRSFGDFEQLTEKVTGIRLQGAANGDEFLRYLVSQHDRLLSLWWLDLTGSVVTDAEVMKLVTFRRLTELNLNRTPVTASVLHIVEWLPELDTFHLEATGVGWLPRKRLEMKLRKRRKVNAARRAVHPTNLQ